MAVVDWLLDSDPSIRWQVMRDLTDQPAQVVAAERTRVATEGWGAKLLALQAPDGLWARNAFSQDYTDTFHVMELLRRLGLDPRSEEARRAVGLVREHVTWGDGAWWNPPWADKGFFEGEVEPCINGNVVATGAYFGQNVTPLVDRLLGEQMDDGGWNCEQERGSTRGSIETTINVLEGLLEFERATGGRADVKAARARGEEYILERRMLRRKSTGEVIESRFKYFFFPTWWHYDVLRGLDYFRDAGVGPDERMAEAIDLVTSKRDADGRWSLDYTYPGEAHFTMEEEGQPSRWNTLRAMRVLRWWDESRRPVSSGSVRRGSGTRSLGG